MRCRSKQILIVKAYCVYTFAFNAQNEGNLYLVVCLKSGDWVNDDPSVLLLTCYFSLGIVDVHE